MTKLLANGKTDLLSRFISKKGRPFRAYLVVNQDKKVGFEFAPRESKAKKAAKTKGKTAKKQSSPSEPEASSSSSSTSSTSPPSSESE